MPYKVVKHKGHRPWKIIRADTGKVVGSAESKAKAVASMRARYVSEKSKQ